MSEEVFLQNFVQNSSQLMWFLGAGASRSSGLPTAMDICWDLKRKLYCTKQNQDIQLHDVSNKAVQARIQSYMDSLGFPPLWDPKEYSHYFEQYFGNNYSSQQKYLAEKLSSSNASSAVGHRILAALLNIGRARLVFTTNFDEVVETAFAAVTGKNLSTFHLEGTYAAIESLNSESFPFYVKLHGDFRYQSVKNLTKDLSENEEQLKKCFTAAATRFGMIVSGYSGRDDNVMALFRQSLEQNNAFPHGLFWLVPRITDAASNVIELIEYAKTKGINSALIEPGTFDEILSKIWRSIPNRPAQMNEKVFSAGTKKVSIPLPKMGRDLPVLRTNALRLIAVPESCGTVDYIGPFDVNEMRTKIFEERPECVLTYTDRILFWGPQDQIEKVIGHSKIRSFNAFPLNELAKMVAESGTMKAFVEEALVKALVFDKPLYLGKSGRTWHAAIKHEFADHELFSPLKQAIKGPIVGKVQGKKDVMWSEAVSLRVEERNGQLWLLLRPDIWISPLKERQTATDFLRERKLKRWNSVSNAILNAWVGIVVAALGGARQTSTTAFKDSTFSATFQLSTRTAYSRRSTSIE